MKKILLSALLITILTSMTFAQKARLNAYAGYVFDDQVEGYSDPSNYFNGTIEGGLQWGFGLEFMANSSKGIEIKYLRQDATATTVYYEGGIRKDKNIELGINYILLGGSNYFLTSGRVAEPYIGGGLGAAIISIKTQLLQTLPPAEQNLPGT